MKIDELIQSLKELKSKRGIKMGNWDNRENLKIIAQYHTEEMERNYKDDIDYSVEHTLIFNNNLMKTYEIKNDFNKRMKIKVVDEDSVTAIINHVKGGHINMVLNFASYKNPGGQFMSGSKAQEEMLCHESNLYNVIKRFPNYYEWNNKNKNKALYTNRALYSEDILFVRGNEEILCDVLTCACPNKGASQKYCYTTDEQNTKALRSRIEFVLKVANYKQAEVLILGAFGCGVFKQDPIEVATIFKEYLYKYPQSFEEVYFAIPNKNSQNYKAFDKVFNNR